MRSPAPWSVDVSAIDQARILRGWTRRELGRQAKVDEGTLCDLFGRRRRPTFGTLRAICQVLDLSLQDVIRFRISPDWAPADRTGTNPTHAV